MWNTENIKQCLFSIASNDWFIGVVAFIGLFYLLRIWSRERLLPIACSKFGHTRTSEHAIKTVICGVCKEIDAIIRVRVCLKLNRGKLRIRLKLKLGTYADLADLTTDLQSRLYAVLADDLGLSNISKIDILVSDFSERSCAAHDKFLSECACEKSSDQEM